MRFRLSRSLVFWLGMPGLCFLLWLWADSFDFATGVDCQRGKIAVSALNDGSTIALGWAENPSAGNYFSTHRTPSSQPKRPLLWAKAERIDRADVQGIILPHWQLSILYLALWFAAMAWRWRSAQQSSPELRQRHSAP